MDARTPHPRSDRPTGPGLTVRRSADALAVFGELDLLTGPRLDRVLRWLEAGGDLPGLDLRDVSFVDCAGWRPVVDAALRRRRHHLPALSILDMSRQVRRFLDLYGENAAGFPPAAASTAAPGSG